MGGRRCEAAKPKARFRRTASGRVASDLSWIHPSQDEKTARTRGRRTQAAAASWIDTQSARHISAVSRRSPSYPPAAIASGSCLSVPGTEVAPDTIHKLKRQLTSNAAKSGFIQLPMYWSNIGRLEWLAISNTLCSKALCSSRVALPQCCLGRRLAPVIAKVSAGSRNKEHLDNLDVTSPRGAMKRHIALWSSLHVR